MIKHTIFKNVFAASQNSRKVHVYVCAQREGCQKKAKRIRKLAGKSQKAVNFMHIIG